MQNINKLIKPNENLTELFMQESSDMIFDVSENASLKLYFFVTGQDINLNVRLIGENAKVEIRAVYLSDTNQNNTLHFCIEHMVSKTYSSQLIKGIAEGTSLSDFYGVIKIPKDSQECEGIQTHKALLLSDDAVIKAVPELEIYADNVKCSHGSSIGALDKNALFYLLSRGIDEKIARQMLIRAFLLSEMPAEFEQMITKWVDNNE